jgi:hypothetical protein
MCSRVGAGSKAGSGVAVHTEPTAMGVVRWPHKIQPGNAVARGSAREDGSNHLAMIANHELMMGAESSDGLGSSVHKFVRGKGMNYDISIFNNVYVDCESCMSNTISNSVSHGSDTYDAGFVFALQFGWLVETT